MGGHLLLWKLKRNLISFREGQRGFSASMSYYSGGGNRSYYIGGFTDGNPMNLITILVELVEQVKD